MFGDDTSQWNFATDLHVADLLYTTTYVAFGDTLIDDKNYHHLEQRFLEDTAYGFIREDKENGKAWYLQLNDSVEHMIMDLSLTLEDTFKLKIPETDNSYLNLIVTDEYNELGRKVLELSGYNHPVRFIEGIGPDYMFRIVESYSVYISYAELLCYYQSNNLLYDVSSYDSCFVWEVTNTSNITNQNIEIHPNPTNSILKIENCNNELINKVVIMDYNGRTYNIKNCKSNIVEIDVSRLPNGIYIIMINDEMTRRIMKYGY